jgi:hypothetical protein
MMNELFKRVAFLEAEIAAIRSVAPPALQPGLDAYAKEYDRKFTPVEGPVEGFAKPLVSRKLCPKCGVKPAYFFHVRTCTGQKEEKQDADTIRRRDQGTP